VLMRLNGQQITAKPGLDEILHALRQSDI
jgi:hypothetical protein